jgi:hypothetical protein
MEGRPPHYHRGRHGFGWAWQHSQISLRACTPISRPLKILLSPEGAAQGQATYLSRPFRARTLLRTDTQGVALGYIKPPLQGSEPVRNLQTAEDSPEP